MIQCFRAKAEYGFNLLIHLHSINQIDALQARNFDYGSSRFIEVIFLLTAKRIIELEHTRYSSKLGLS